MANHAFTALYAQYPVIISRMRQEFSSNEFILELAHLNQMLYVEGLYSYRHHLRDARPAPFMMVHSVLAQHLEAYPALIEQIPEGA